MRKLQTLPLSDILKLIVRENTKLEDGLDSAKLKAIWANATSKHIAKLTKELKVSNKTLTVTVNSSIVRNEILLIKSELIIRINKEIGRDFISQIVLR